MRRVAIILVAALPIAACGYRIIGPAGQESSGMPIARATNGGSASFGLTTCAPNTERARLVEEIVLQLNQQGVIAVADGPGTQSRVTLNLCGSGGVAAAAPRAAR